MPKASAPYSAKFRQLVELVQAGRRLVELSRNFGPTSQTIINWVAEVVRDAGKHLPSKNGQSSAQLNDLSRLRRENSLL